MKVLPQEIFYSKKKFHPFNILIKRFIFLVSILLLYINTSIAQSNLSGDISSRHLVMAQSPYYVQADCIVGSGTSLTVDPGVSVLFCGEYRITLFGSLYAIGNDTLPINFTSSNPSIKWTGITSNENGNNIIMKYCHLSNSDSRRFTVGLSPWDGEGGILTLRCLYFDIQNCIFENNSGRWAGAVYGRFYGHTTDNLFANNIIRNNYAEEDAGGVAFMSDGRIIIENNLIYKNTAGNFSESVSGGGMLLHGRYIYSYPGVPNYRVKNNTIVYNRLLTPSGGSGLDFNNFLLAEDTPTISNNIIYGNMPPSQVGTASGHAKFYKNNIGPDIPFSLIPLNYNYVPLFVNDSGNYMLKNASLLYNLADTSFSLSNNYDRLHTSRPQLSNNDIGAYEMKNGWMVEFITHINNCCKSSIEVICFNPNMGASDSIYIMLDSSVIMNHTLGLHIDSFLNLCRGNHQLTIYDKLHLEPLYQKTIFIENLNYNIIDSIIYDSNVCSNTINFNNFININSCSSTAYLWTYDIGQIDTVYYNSDDSVHINSITFLDDTLYHITISAINNACPDTFDFYINIHNPVNNDTINYLICYTDSMNIHGNYYNRDTTLIDTFTAFNGCDSFFVNQVKIIQPINTIINYVICNDDSILINGNYIHSTTTIIDTLNSNLRCDSFVTYSVQVNPISNTFLSTSICNNDSILFNGIHYTSTGIYYDTLANQFGCDSLIELNLIVLPNIVTILNHYTCLGNPYWFNERLQYTSGTYSDTLNSIDGCDSIVELHLQFLDTNFTTINSTICLGDTIKINNHHYFNSGIYFDTVLNTVGCDSVVQLTLTIVHPVGLQTIQICEHDSILINHIYRYISGIYYDTLTSYLGCDSVVQITLTVVHAVGLQTIQICEHDSILINHIYRYISGIYYDTLTSYLGCDSVVQITLTVVHAVGLQTIQICEHDSILINHIYRYISGIYYDTLTSYLGCDSIITIILNINNQNDSSENLSLCYGQFYLGNFYLNDTSWTEYTHNIFGCDSTYTISIHIKPNPEINIGNDTCITQGESIVLYATGANDYFWNNGLNNSTINVSPTITTTYFVQGINADLCTGFDTITICVKEKSDSTYFAIPSAFSPNGDGLNDIFKVLVYHNLKLELMRIFNRWGELIYETNISTEGWDGNYKNRQQPLGTYVYYLEMRNTVNNNIENHTGSVTLMR